MMSWSRMKPAEKFCAVWEEFGFAGSDMELEYRFDMNHGFLLDFAWPSCKVAVEIHGLGPGHMGTKGLCRDCTKMRHAILMGWIVLPFSTPCISSRANAQAAVALVNELLSKRHPDASRG